MAHGGPHPLAGRLLQRDHGRADLLGAPAQQRQGEAVLAARFAVTGALIAAMSGQYRNHFQPEAGNHRRKHGSFGSRFRRPGTAGDDRPSALKRAAARARQTIRMFAGRSWSDNLYDYQLHVRSNRGYKIYRLPRAHAAGRSETSSANQRDVPPKHMGLSADGDERR